VAGCATPQTVAFSRSDFDEVYENLSFAHRQHHDIVRARRAAGARRVESLMRVASMRCA
jgi:hypothetical protein